jgi:hypothetical protein
LQLVKWLDSVTAVTGGSVIEDYLSIQLLVWLIIRLDPGYTLDSDTEDADEALARDERGRPVPQQDATEEHKVRGSGRLASPRTTATTCRRS